jgi:hypothetical protein
MKKTKLTAVLLVLTLLIGALCSCRDILSIREYNAQMYPATDMLLSSFVDEHRVGGLIYENPDYVEGVDDRQDKYYCDITSPNFWAIIIKDREEFDKAFKENSLDVDFDTEMVLLYIFSSSIAESRYIIDMVAVDRDKACIYFGAEKNVFQSVWYRLTFRAGWSAPRQACLAVKMNKADITSVDFIENIIWTVF